MIFDCHTHWGIAWVQRDGDDPSAWLGALDHHGVDRALLCGHAGLQDQEACPQDNDLVARVAAKAPGRLVPFGTCWPNQGEKAVAEASRCLETLGMRGIKLHPWLQGFSASLPVMEDLCHLAARHDAPILFHDGTPCYSLSEQIIGLARRQPATRIILGHAGLLWNWRSVLAAGVPPNVWVCLCGPHLRAVELLCRRLDPSRLLWGSDFGFTLDDTIEYRLGLLRHARIDDQLRERVLGENPLALVGDKRP